MFFSANHEVAKPRLAALTAVMLLLASGITSCSSGSGGISNVSPATGKVKHVFILTLENKSFSTTFGSSSPVPYLTQTLAAQGATLQGYYGTGHVSLDNYVSMVSGQSGTVDTVSDCQTYQDFTQTSNNLVGNSQIVGTGCVYPASVKTIADQLTAANLTWKAYMGDMGNDPARESATCGHPTLNTQDLTQVAEAPSSSVPNGDFYATRHDPFMYFHSIIDSPACQTNVVNMQNNLANDLASISTTANFNFITPNLCQDGHDNPCADGTTGGYPAINAFLTTYVPMILNSPAYKQDGLLIINFDESNYSASVNNGVETLTFPGNSCCNEQPGPNLPAYPETLNLGAYTLVYGGYGGDNTGAIVLSPFIKPGTVSAVPYNHYSMLRTIEDIFGLPHLGNAQDTELVPFGTDVFTGL
jgi:phospholipase C